MDKLSISTECIAYTPQFFFSKITLYLIWKGRDPTCQIALNRLDDSLRSFLFASHRRLF